MDEKHSPKLSRSNKVGQNQNLKNSNETVKTQGTLISKFSGSSKDSGLICDLYNDQLLNEARKIVEQGLKKDFTLLEKNKIIEEATETIDNLRKNIIHIQMEYEQLDKNYQKEISYRTELLKRTDTTRNMIESAAHYSNILATSIKQLEDDKFKIAEFYNEIHQLQEEAEKKRKKIDMIISDQDDLIKNAVYQVEHARDKALEEIAQLNNKLMNIHNKHNLEMDKKKELETEMEKLKEDMIKIKAQLIHEQTDKVQFESVQSQLKRKIIKQRMQFEKMYKVHRLKHQKKIKNLKIKLQDMQEKLNLSEASFSNSNATVEDLRRESRIMEEELDEMLKACKNHAKESIEIKEKLEKCLTEKENLSSQIHQLKDELENERLRSEKLIENQKNLMKDFEIQNAEVKKKKSEYEILLQENLHLKRKVNEITKELQDLELKYKYQNLEESTEKIISLESEIQKYQEIERNLQKQVTLLEQSKEKESSNNRKIISEKQNQINELETTMKELIENKHELEKQIHSFAVENNEVERELRLKSNEMEKLVVEFEKKMNTISHETESTTKLKENLELEKLKKEELIEKNQKLEEQKILLEMNFKEDLEKEKAMNKALEWEKNEHEKAVQKLRNELEKEKKKVKSEREKLNQALIEISDLKKLSDKLRESEETVINLKKTLESADANLEAYKVIIQKLENEAKGKNKQNDEVMSTKSDSFQAKRMCETSENRNAVLNADKEEKNQVVNKSQENESANHQKMANETLSRPRRLLSTPNRHLTYTFPSPKFKSLTPKRNTRDPYEFDSDSSSDRSNTNIKSAQALIDFQAMQKKENFTRKRKK